MTNLHQMWLPIAATLTAIFTLTQAQCPWHLETPDLQSSCLCSYNLGHELSVQCDMVDWPKLLAALNKYGAATTIDLLYVNNSTVGALKDNIFSNLKIHNVQLSGCGIKNVAKDAFNGQERHLKILNLQDNDLSEIPIDSLKPLKSMTLLDLSHNRIARVPPKAFITLTKLATLKLSDNNVTLEDGALDGLEGCLKNLNLKGTRQKEVPRAIRGMKTLAFLDLSQNSLVHLSGDEEDGAFVGLKSLTAINLERNLIQNLERKSFIGVRKTLSSLSLLNNLLPDYPKDALSPLGELRVLDIGFNLLTELPVDAFAGNPSITLLALDGNPLVTIPYEALSHLNRTLRGLSLGGRFLHCDCRLSWVIRWIKDGDLQVTSRERNPQFCGSPPRFRDRGFYNIQHDELCPNETKEPSTEAPKKEKRPIGVATVVSAELDDVSLSEPEAPKSTTTTKKPTPKIATSTTVTTTTVTTSKSKATPASKATTPKPSTTAKPKAKTTTSWSGQQRPSLIMNYPHQRNKADESKEVLVKSAFRQDNAVIIQWGSETANILGFRVVYRLFGDKSFKQGPPLEASEREFKIKNVPSQECIIVCVVSLEDINVSPDTVPFAQCREVRTASSSASNMDKITIAASAAICGTIVIAVIIFIAASRRRSRKLHELHHQHKLSMKNGLPMAGLPVNCCSTLGPNGSPGGPMSSLATLNGYNANKDWDQVSAYSTHSIQRPRMFSVDHTPSLIPDDSRSHFGHKGNKPRSIADGQSQHSFSNNSGRYLTANAFPNNLLSSRQDLRQSRQSLAMQSDRLSTRLGAAHAHHHNAPARSVSSSTRRSRPRSRSRDRHARSSGRYSTAGSTRTLNNYCDNSDNNWTDHDMEIYMARNPTTRNGLVPL